MTTQDNYNNDELQKALEHYKKECEACDWNDDKLSFAAKLTKSHLMWKQTHPDAMPTPRQIECILRDYKNPPKKVNPEVYDKLLEILKPHVTSLGYATLSNALQKKNRLTWFDLQAVLLQ